MNIIVCIKQVPDTETKIKVSADKKSIDETGIKWVMNPYDEFAVEEALKLKEKNAGSTVTVYTVGPKRRVVESLRTALAMGADSGVVVDSELKLDPLASAKALAGAIKKSGDFAIVFTGKQAIDDNAASVSQMLAEFLSVPHATVVSKFTWEGGSVVIERETEGGSKEIVQVKAPAVIAANKGLNNPRYASLPGIMKAKSKPVKEMTLADVGVSEAEIRTIYSDFQLPPEKPPVKILAGDLNAQAHELVRLLKDEARVL